MPIRGEGFGIPIRLPKRKKDLPVRKEFEYNPIGSFRDVNPYDVAFCYPHPLYHRPFIVKGGVRDTRKYLRKLNIPMVVHHTFYQRGKHRRLVQLYGVDKRLQISKDFSYDQENENVYLKSRKFQLKRLGKGLGDKREVLAEFKRIPRRWIRELNLYVTVERRFP